MPMNYDRYPRTWKAISKFIRFYRAEGRCEWCGAVNGKPHPLTGGIVTLTVHHIGIDKPDGRPGDRHDKMDCRLANLAALCNRCHWIADWDIHYAKAIAAKRQKRIAAGQMELFK